MEESKSEKDVLLSPQKKLTEDEIQEIKSSWNRIISDKSGEHGVNIFMGLFKSYPEIRGQYFQTLSTLSEAELRSSPKLQGHGSGVVLAITQIINGLENPLVAAEVAKKIARTHFQKGVNVTNYTIMTNTILQYIKITGNLSDFAVNAYDKMFQNFIFIAKKKYRELEVAAAKKVQIKKMKNFMMMLGIALIVLVIEKMSEFITAIIYGAAAAAKFCDCSGQNNTINV